MEISIGEMIMEEEVEISDLKLDTMKEYPSLENLIVIPTGEQQVFNHPNSYGYGEVIVEPINLQDKEITLNKNGVYNIKADKEYSGLNNVEVTLDAIEDLDVELNTYNEELTEQTTTIEDIVETLKEKGIIGAKELNVTPSKDNQVIEGIYNKVNVAGDEDLIPENIKSGVDIFGVIGTGEMSDIVITDASYLFYNGARMEYYEEIKKLFGELTNTSSMFSQNTGTKEYNLEGLNTSKAQRMDNMFHYNYSLESIDLSSLDTQNVFTMNNFLDQNSLEVLDLSVLDLNNLEYASSFMAYCNKLKNIIFGNNDFSKVKYLSNFVNGCTVLVDLDMSMLNLESCSRVDGTFNRLTNLVNFKFPKNLGKGFTATSNNNYLCTVDLHYSTLLTHDSLMSVINNLYDLNLTYDVANGGTLYTQQLVLGADNLAKLTEEEISIVTAKGWVVS